MMLRQLYFSQPSCLLGKKRSAAIMPGFLKKNRLPVVGGLLRPKLSWYVSRLLRMVVTSPLVTFTNLV